MARVFPFQPYRYADTAGPLDRLVTQPYDKISPAMRERYLSLSPYNLVRVILGERLPDDNDTNNVYTRADRHLTDWIAGGQLVKESAPAFYAYFQEFAEPDSGERLLRKGFIGLGPVEDYSAGVVYRHEQTLTGPKKDRLELLRHTHAHFGQLFMVYPDPEGAIDRLLDQCAEGPPDAAVTDEYQAIHRLWRISDPTRVAEIQALMADKKLLIADGHHRYETALAFRKENPDLADAQKVMMTFVNMHSPGLRILATHRLINGLASFDARQFVSRVKTAFNVTTLSSLDQLKQAWKEPHEGRSRIGMVIAGFDGFLLAEAAKPAGQLDVKVLHDVLLDQMLGISADAVREESYTRYIRGVDAAVEEVRKGAAQIGFLLQPTSIEEVAAISFAGGVMPQKSTDFYPKLLSGLTVYKLQ